MSTVWNPDAYRLLSLSECHWKLCRRFMALHQHSFPEEKTVALAHIFANTQLLMEGDAERTMQLVLDLVKDDWSAEDAGVKVVVKRERESVENEGIKVEDEQLEELPAEVAVKEEPEEDVKPQNTTIKVEPEKGGEAGPSSLLEMTMQTIVKTETIDLSDDEEFSSAYGDSPKEESLISNCPKNKEDECKTNLPVVTEFDADILADLTRFKPPETLRNFGDICRSFVIFDHLLCESRIHFERLGLGFLVITCNKIDDIYRCSIAVKTGVKQFHLAEDYAPSKIEASNRAERQFRKKMKGHCYQIVLKKPSSLPENHIARLESPWTNIEYYKTIMKNFKKAAVRPDLMFNQEFSKLECLRGLLINLN